MAYELPTKTFAGVRFILLGFNPVDTQQVRGKLVSEGGVDAGQYGPNCTHVIVNNLVYYDPICAAARSDGKILVTDLWVDHSFDVSMPVDATNVMYRPVRELGGIPGAKSLVVCLTGYHGHARGDIVTMVGLMGACFSKALVSTKVTHLICYKFEGDKYNSAKKWGKIKTINHHWLEDCLRAWEIFPEENYCRSGYELETMEPEGIARKQYEAQEMDVNPRNLPEDTATENTIPNQYRHEKLPQVKYRPRRDFGGIPGAKSLVVCLTGYSSRDRNDIMKMASRMGAKFSPPLTKKVTHLICYKFEGEKYKVAKRCQKIKLVNHHWLKDCLRAREILPEEYYNKSGYELETVEPEGGQGITRKQYYAREMDVSPCSLAEETSMADKVSHPVTIRRS